MRRAAAIAAAVGLGAALAGCGLGAGERPAGTKLTITRDFGARALRDLDAPKVGGDETVMRVLERNAKVSTRYGGGFVQSIDGLAGGRSRGRPVDWFYYVNGIEASRGAAATSVRGGDRVWWDRHDWGAAMRVPAVVGSFPEPFVHGIDGKRLPVRIECATPGSAPCRQVSKRLASYDVPAATGGLLTARVQDTLRVLVGPWRILREDHAVAGLEQGPSASGVYARIARDGRSIVALDARGRAARTLGSGTGLVAATAVGDERPTWVVTGTDEAGVVSAVGAFEEGTLGRRFAVAVSHDRAIALPVTP
ncbi:MAG TPA: DUF4430 domain-containing protein [Solirubrobacteraceae bacterium]